MPHPGQLRKLMKTKKKENLDKIKKGISNIPQTKNDHMLKLPKKI